MSDLQSSDRPAEAEGDLHEPREQAEEQANPRIGTSRHEARLDSSRQRPIAPNTTTASVGRTTAIPASDAAASTTCRVPPPSNLLAISAVIASPRIAAQRFGSTADPLNTKSQEDVKNAAAIGAARPMSGIVTANVTPTATDDSTIRNRRTCSTDPPDSVIGAMRYVIPRARNARRNIACISGVTWEM